LTLFGQQTVVSGKVTEAATGTPIPFANVVFTGTQEGAITDFDGNFKATTTKAVDSIEVRYVGFVKRVKPLKRGTTQIIDFQLDEEVTSLGEMVFYAGENPAFDVLRKVVKNKKFNDKRSLDAYEYESYTKIEFDVDNLSDQFRQRKIVQKITNVLDSIEQIAGEDGKPVLPIFLSEAISRVYYRSNPVSRTENMIKTKISGVGITDGTLTSQVIGSTFQEYNFYQNWLNILDKEFISPIADGWRISYEYDLLDSVYIDGVYCYELNFFPKRVQDLAFWGKMWITTEDYALRRIDAFVPKSANLNFIEKLKIQQDLFKTDAGAWLPEKTRVVVDVAQLSDKSAGFLGKFYISTSDHVINQPKGTKFYQNPVTMEEDVRDETETYWSNARHDPLSETEVHVFQMIDTLKKIPAVKAFTEINKFLVNGYTPWGKFEIGPYTTFFGNNDIEGVRLGFGARTNLKFSKKWVLGGYMGYGFDDQEWKYRTYAKHIVDRKKWTTVQLEVQKEVEQVWLLNENIEPNSLFYSLSRFGTLTQPFSIYKFRLHGSRQVSKAWDLGLSAKYHTFDPLFNFGYYTDAAQTNTAAAYQVAEMGTSIKFAKDELYVINDNERLSLGTLRWPAITLNYTLGLPNVLESDFEYHKINFNLKKNQKMGQLGVSSINVNAGKIFGDVPYTLLYNPIGNETPVYVGFAYNLLNYFEFSSDQYLDVRYRHSFEGLFLNRIPLLKKLKWRTIGTANMLWGSMSDENFQKNVYQNDINGDPILPFSPMNKGAYLEMGYGIENILKVFSIQAFHRITYRDTPGTNNFGVKFNVQIVL
jgi:hypothetical protein